MKIVNWRSFQLQSLERKKCQAANCKTCPNHRPIGQLSQVSPNQGGRVFGTTRLQAASMQLASEPKRTRRFTKPLSPRIRFRSRHFGLAKPAYLSNQQKFCRHRNGCQLDIYRTYFFLIISHLIYKNSNNNDNDNDNIIYIY